jgi:hypothetical protein
LQVLELFDEAIDILVERGWLTSWLHVFTQLNLHTPNELRFVQMNPT